MKHFIDSNNVYHIIDDETKEDLLLITLTDEPGDQIILENKNDVYSGPINLIFE